MSVEKNTGSKMTAQMTRAYLIALLCVGVILTPLTVAEIFPPEFSNILLIGLLILAIFGDFSQPIDVKKWWWLPLAALACVVAGFWLGFYLRAV